MSQQLPRSLGLWDAVWIGLGSILGTGAFVGLAIATNLAGPSVLIAVVVAGLLALANGLSSAQLAASHPVSGGTYEYGYRYLSPAWGFTAGWLFLLAKSASAATAAMGAASYAANLLGFAFPLPLALGVVAIATALVTTGVRRTKRWNAILVSLTLISLAGVMGVGLLGQGPVPISGVLRQLPWVWPQSVEAIALVFVAYTGYGRIATLGEEVVAPERTIPRAIYLCLGLTMLIYGAIALVLVRFLQTTDAPVTTQLGQILQHSLGPTGWLIVMVGALSAMLGVLLNLVLGLSRTVLAMARRQDLPPVLARLNPQQTSPTAAVWVTGGAIALELVLFGGRVQTTWSLSALAVLLYYSITNWAALQLPQPRYPRWIAGVGLVSCGFLAVWVEGQAWWIGAIALGLGWAYRWGLKRRYS